MNLDEAKILIARRIAKELESNSYVNLGLGLPTAVADYVDPAQNIIIHGENGIIGVGKECSSNEVCDINVINSGGNPTHVISGASFFDSTTSFGMIRGGHIDVTILGTMEVDQEGNIANYQIPGKRLTGMGGAMDLCVGAKKVIVATYHTVKGAPKILKKCRLPLTAQKVVNTIVTEMAVIDVTPNGLLLRDYNREFSIQQIQECTEAELVISSSLL